MLHPLFQLARSCFSPAKALFCAFAMIVCSGPGFAQPGGALDYKISGDKIVIPFEYTMHQIVLQASAPGAPKMSLLLDTGSEYCVLDSDLKLEGSDDKQIGVNIHQGKKKMMKFSLNSLKLGEGMENVSVSNLPVLRNDYSRVSAKLKRRIDGVLGLSFLSGYVLEIDYPGRKLRFSLPENEAMEPSRIRNAHCFRLMLLNPRQPFSILTLDGTFPQNRMHPLIIDTGFGGVACFTHKVAKESGLLQEDTVRTPAGSTDSEGANRCEAIIASKLLLGSIDLSGETVLIDPPLSASVEHPGMIGNRFLENYLVIYDYKNKSLTMQSTKVSEAQN